MSESKDTSINDVFRQMTEILERTLTRVTEVEQHISKDLESIRRQLDAVGVLKDNIANLNNRIDSLSKKLSELSKSEPQELSRLLLRAISELDKRMQMFTVTEVLSRLESGYNYAQKPLSNSSEKRGVSSMAKPPRETEPTSSSPKAAEATSAPSSAPAQIDAHSEAHGSDQPWRERMREKYGLKKKPGAL